MLQTAVLTLHVLWNNEEKWIHCVLTSSSPLRTSSSLVSMYPSLRSLYRSDMRQDTLDRWELTHLVKVFFCTASRSSEENRKISFTSKGKGNWKNNLVPG